MKTRADSLILHMDGAGPVLIQHSPRAKRMSIRVYPEGVKVVVPLGLSLSRGRDFAESKCEWIRHHVQRLHCLAEEQAEAARTAPDLPDRKKAREKIVNRLQELSLKHGLPYGRVMVRNQKTRWGSCSYTNTISLNIKLARLPQELMDYVILHELVHTRIKGHGKRFWSRLDTLAGDARGLRKELRRYSLVIL